MKKIFTAFIVLLTTFTFAQSKGKITGVVKDKDMGLEPLPFVSVYVQGNSSIGTTTDFDGNYSLPLLPGKHIIVFDFVGYKPIKKDIDVKEDESMVINVEMEALAQALNDVIITTKRARNTEKAVLTLQKEATVTMDAISSEAIKKTGASDVAGAVKAVTGVSVEGGKYVVVRGLNDRYTKTLLNGAQIPGLDPDKNAVQLDLFPTGILDNVSVIKSGSAEYPADFTGGVVDIITKSISGERVGNFNIGLGYNPDMHFNANFLEDPSTSGTDLLGFDSGDRDLPIAREADIPINSVGNNEELRGVTNSFISDLAANNTTSSLNYNYGATYGNSTDIGTSKLGYLGSFSYKSETTFYEEAIDGSFVRSQANDVKDKLFVEGINSKGSEGVVNTALTLSAGLFLDNDYSNYKLKVLHILNGESGAGIYNQTTSLDGGALETLLGNELYYTERSFTNILLSGSHFNEEGDWNIKWIISPTLSKANDLANRVTRFLLQENSYVINSGTGGFPIQVWRFLDEITLDNHLDFDKKHKVFGQDAKLKFGGAYTWKQRDFSIDDFIFTSNPTNLGAFSDGDANSFLADENLIDDNGVGTFIQFNNTFSPESAFEAQQTTSAFYVSEELRLFKKLKTILGLRAEQFRSIYTGRDTAGQDIVEEELINDLSFFPSANLILELNDKFNIRGSYGRTTARPSFKEASGAAINDPITGRTFNGNTELVPTFIDNLDLRFEFYGDNGSFFAVSGFYKQFKDPIELTFFDSAPSQFQPRNLGDSEVIGAEVEFRYPIIDGLSFNFNASRIYSELEISDDEYSLRFGDLAVGQTVTQELLSRSEDSNDSYTIGSAVLGETSFNTRNLQGQSPYIINSGISYENKDKAFNTALAYNVQGETLEVVGTGNVPDIFTQSFHSLNLTGSKGFGEDQKHKINFKVSNLLDDDRESFFEAYGVSSEIFKLRSPGRQFSLSYTYKF